MVLEHLFRFWEVNSGYLHVWYWSITYHSHIDDLIGNENSGYARGMYNHLGTAVAQWLRYCATNEKVTGSIPTGVIGIFHWHNPSYGTMALGLTQPLTEMSTRSISWGKGGRCIRLTTLPPSCAVVTKSGNLNFLEASGPLSACNETALPFFFFQCIITQIIRKVFLRNLRPIIGPYSDDSLRSLPIFTPCFSKSHFSIVPFVLCQVD